MPTKRNNFYKNSRFSMGFNKSLLLLFLMPINNEDICSQLLNATSRRGTVYILYITLFKRSILNWRQVFLFPSLQTRKVSVRLCKLPKAIQHLGCNKKQICVNISSEIFSIKLITPHSEWCQFQFYSHVYI